MGGVGGVGGRVSIPGPWTKKYSCFSLSVTCSYPVYKLYIYVSLGETKQNNNNNNNNNNKTKKVGGGGGRWRKG